MRHGGFKSSGLGRVFFCIYCDRDHRLSDATVIISAKEVMFSVQLVSASLFVCLYFEINLADYNVICWKVRPWAKELISFQPRGDVFSMFSPSCKAIGLCGG